MKLFANDAQLQATQTSGPFRNSSRSIAAFLLLAALAPLCPHAMAEEGVAVAIIYDTSGSMKDPVKDLNGKLTPKYLIANRALEAIANQLEAFATNGPGGQPRKVEAGVFKFSHDDATEVVKFGPFDPKAIHEFAQSFSAPAGSTPLGNALNTASRALLKSSLARRHILVITDGLNTAGPEPSAVLPRVKQRAESSGTAVSVHFVAFDVAAKIFDAVKKQGATVVAAADEKQLNSQLEFIMQRKILLEEEEPSKKR
jgi:VWA domain-containing protein